MTAMAEGTMEQVGKAGGGGAVSVRLEELREAIRRNRDAEASVIEDRALCIRRSDDQIDALRRERRILRDEMTRLGAGR